MTKSNNYQELCRNSGRPVKATAPPDWLRKDRRHPHEEIFSNLHMVLFLSILLPLKNSKIIKNKSKSKQKKGFSIFERQL